MSGSASSSGCPFLRPVKQEDTTDASGCLCYSRESLITRPFLGGFPSCCSPCPSGQLFRRNNMLNSTGTNPEKWNGMNGGAADGLGRESRRKEGRNGRQGVSVKGVCTPASSPCPTLKECLPKEAAFVNRGKLWKREKQDGWQRRRKNTWERPPRERRHARQAIA